MPRKIALLSDGTGNSAGQIWKTNVWRVFERIDLSGDEQVAYYDDGVGTASFKPAALIGGAFGIGLKRNLIDLYMFACRNYRGPGDEVFAFGFSRGAFTIRLLVGLILQEGLASAKSERELRGAALAAYHRYRERNFHTIWPKRLRPENLARGMQALFAKELPFEYRKNVIVRFVGIWDTVGAYGMPVEELARGISDYIWPWMFTDRKLHRDVKRACHALSIDDERTTFHPILWDEREEGREAVPGASCFLRDERISQVWFPGVHANVGGGYPDDALSQVSLTWMLREAVAAGLKFKDVEYASPQTAHYPCTARDKDGRLYDSRTGFGGYYRYGPRDIEQVSKHHLANVSADVRCLPKIHVSALQRIRNRAHAYAPVGFPRTYSIVYDNGRIEPPHENAFEEHEQARARWNSQQRLGDLIFMRQCVYLLTVLLSLFILAYPALVTTDPVSEFKHPLRWISDVVRAVGACLPDAASTWINAFARSPALFAISACGIAALTALGSSLKRRIDSVMDGVWQRSLSGTLTDPGRPDTVLYCLRTNPALSGLFDLTRRRIVPAVFAIALSYGAAAWVSHLTFNIIDTAGFVCRETLQPGHGQLARGEVVLSHGRTASLEELRKAADRDNTISDADKANPFQYIRDLPEFDTTNPCQSMAITLDEHQKVLIRFRSTEDFADGHIPAANGFATFDPPGIWTKFVMLLALPLRRELFQPWFRVAARIGGTGGEESFLEADLKDPIAKINERLTARRDGELFLFVNDAVLPIPGLTNIFYGNNRGKTRVYIEGL